jgi:asparagine synthase (glutamine-hydrolysing)
VCGLCGAVDLGGLDDVTFVERMADALVHRGPDDRGAYADAQASLGFLRLSIIDPSPLGHQPMAAADGDVQLLFNGEIYNYRELRRDLIARGHMFRSESDSEVLLASYLEWGTACVNELRGMWAFAIWDRRPQRLFCSVDRFGIKPFYYSHAGSRLVFASEPKAFRAAGISMTPDLEVVRDYLAFGAVDQTSRTFFEGIERLPGAHSLVFDHHGLSVTRYWDVPRDGHRPTEPVDAARRAFLESISLHLRSDVPVGTCLSGGIDSSAVACTVGHLLRTSEEATAVGTRQRTFTAYFPRAGFDERPYARAVVEAAGCEPHWVTFDDETFVDDLPAIVFAQDEPFGSTSMVAQWYVMKAAGEAGLKVMLDGQGADEIFAGYLTSYGPFLADLLLRGRLGRFLREAAATDRLHDVGAWVIARTLVRSLTPEQFTRRFQAHESGGGRLLGERLPRTAPRHERRSGDGSLLRRQLIDLLTRTQLPELLRYEDRNSMAHSIEARVPMLDHRLVELALSLSGDDLIENGVTKTVLRRALSDLLPTSVASRVDKLGFVTPLDHWFSSPGLGQFAREVFNSPATRSGGLVNADECLRLLDEGTRGTSRAFALWRALNVALWADIFLREPQRV